MEKSLEKRVREAVREPIEMVPYDPSWPDMFAAERDFLRKRFPRTLIKRIEHFGSTAVPGMSAKPVVDMLVEVNSLDEARQRIVPALEAEGYEYFWRTDIQPPYAWFIKRDADGRRTHHIHMVESWSALWDRLYFRDYLRDFPREARRYEELKRRLAREYTNDREAYTRAKGDYINSVTAKAKKYFSS